MDLATSAGADLIRVIDGREHRFPILRLADIADLQQQLRAEERAELLRSLKDSGLAPKEQFEELRRFDASRRYFMDCARTAWEPLGARLAILASLKRINPQATLSDVDALALSIDEMVTLAIELWGFRINGGDAGKADPLPPAEGQPASATG